MRVLVIAPHPDDEIIGVGGTIAKRVNNGDEVYVCVVTKGQEPMFKKEFIEQGRTECREENWSRIHCRRWSCGCERHPGELYCCGESGEAD